MGFPNALGVIDGTHVRIGTPSGDRERNFVNRKLQHSLNCQIVCDADYVIINAVIKWPGSTHDAFIWNNCSLHNLFIDGIIVDGWLIGDSGYPLQPCLITPLLNPQTRPEKNFNSSLTAVRSTVERCIGILKSRFRCLDQTAGKLLFTPERCIPIISACCKLHNLCRKRNLPFDQTSIENIVEAENEFPNEATPPEIQTGVAVRNKIIRDYFT